MKLIKQKKTHTGHEKYQYRIEPFSGDFEFSNMLKFLKDSFWPSSMYPLLKPFPQSGNESWTWLHRITQKTSDRYILIRDDIILSVLLFKYPQLTHDESQNRKTIIFTYLSHSLKNSKL